jgi:hypothetical protein
MISFACVTKGGMRSLPCGSEIPAVPGVSMGGAQAPQIPLSILVSMYTEH